MIDHREIARRLALAMHPHALIDGGEVVQHPVRPIDFFFEKAKQRAHAIFRHPKRGYAIVRVLSDSGTSQAGR